MSPAPDGPRRVVLSVPALAEPPVSSGCCAVGRDDVLLEEIDTWPGLLALDVDPEQGTAVVLVTPGHDEDLTAALEALSDRGLPAAVLPPGSPDPGPGRRPRPAEAQPPERTATDEQENA